MSEIKHTPGPWRLDDRTFSVMANGSVDTIEGCVLSRIITCHPLVVHDLEGREWHCGGNQLANARLIAAAPELLSVLRECREVCLVGDDDGISVSEDVVIPAPLFDRICAAIAKAEGRE